jgi:hypothetical protein
MALYLGGQRMKIALNGVLCLPLYTITDTAINLLTKDGYILLDSEELSLKAKGSDTTAENFSFLTTSDGFALMDSQGLLLSIGKTTDSTVSSNILMSSDNYMLLDFDNKKLII